MTDTIRSPRIEVRDPLVRIVFAGPRLSEIEFTNQGRDSSPVRLTESVRRLLEDASAQGSHHESPDVPLVELEPIEFSDMSEVAAFVDELDAFLAQDSVTDEELAHQNADATALAQRIESATKSTAGTGESRLVRLSVTSLGSISEVVFKPIRTLDAPTMGREFMTAYERAFADAQAALLETDAEAARALEGWLR